MTNLKSGELRHRLTIEKKTNKIGTRGQQLDEWEEIGRLWGKVSSLWGQELEIARRRQENVSVRVVTRNQKAREMNPSYRLRHKSQILNIGFIQLHGDELDDIHIMCSSTVQ